MKGIVMMNHERRKIDNSNDTSIKIRLVFT